MTVLDTSTPVLVLNAVHCGALAITRSLGRLGIPVYNQAPFHSVPAFRSHYSKGNFVWDHDAAGAESTVEFLLSIGKKLERPALLVPTCDVTALITADYDEVLRSCFLFPKQHPDLVHGLCSKKRMYEFAVLHGIPTPATSFPGSRKSVLEFLEAACFPIVVKSVKNRLGNMSARGIKTIVRNRQQLLSVWDTLADPGDPNLMLQEYIPGGEDSNWMFNGYFDSNSDCLIGLTGQKLRQFPAYAGVTSLGECASNEEVQMCTRTFMKALGYKGMLDMGYRYDARDSRYKVYDINPRIGATFRLFVDTNSNDVARVFYLNMTQQPVYAGHICEGRRWLVEDSDFVSSIRYYRDGTLTFREWLSSLRRIDETAVFASDDILPVGARILNHVQKLAHNPLLRTRPQRSDGVRSTKEATDSSL